MTRTILLLAVITALLLVMLLPSAAFGRHGNGHRPVCNTTTTTFADSIGN